jgi:hypothetical protein
VQMWQGWAQSQCRCGRGGPCPGADVAGMGSVPVQMCQVQAESGCRCGRGFRLTSSCLMTPATSRPEAGLPSGKRSSFACGSSRTSSKQRTALVASARDRRMMASCGTCKTQECANVAGRRPTWILGMKGRGWSIPLDANGLKGIGCDESSCASLSAECRPCLVPWVGPRPARCGSYGLTPDCVGNSSATPSVR